MNVRERTFPPNKYFINAMAYFRMEEDCRSDSGVSTLRSDGARSSGDERSGSRSSAVSDARPGPSPHQPDPDIRIVGTVPASHAHYSNQPARHKHDHDTAQAYQAQARAQAMADPRHAAALGSQLSGAQLSALAAAAHYGPGPQSQLPAHLMPQASAAALLQYQQLAAAALGESPQPLSPVCSL